jgi:hypothetical protein
LVPALFGNLKRALVPEQFEEGRSLKKEEE